MDGRKHIPYHFCDTNFSLSVVLFVSFAYPHIFSEGILDPPCLCKSVKVSLITFSKGGSGSTHRYSINHGSRFQYWVVGLLSNYHDSLLTLLISSMEILGALKPARDDEHIFFTKQVNHC